MRNLWHHNLACALIAEQLAKAGQMDKDIAYTSGVMHDIGRLALAVIRPREFALLLGTHSGTPCSIMQGERDLFGWDHCETGRQLISDWKLPPEFDAVVADHHSPRQTDGPWGITELIKVSCRMADAVGFPAFPGCEAAPYRELLEEIPAKERETFPAELEALAEEVGKRVHAVETA